MPFVQLYDVLPDLAEAETRSMIVFDNGEPTVTYSLVEMFCNERGCDCRRAFIQVVSDDPSVPQPRATISWGWESAAFYRRWASFPLNEEDLDELRGPALARLHRQSEEADALLAQVRDVLADEAYAARVIRHYHAFRAALGETPSPSPPSGRGKGKAVAKRRAKNKQRRKARAQQRRKRK